MEFFTRTYSQLQGVYRSMTPSFAGTVGALAVVVLLTLDSWDCTATPRRLSICCPA